MPERTGIANLPLHYGIAPARYSFAHGGKDAPYPVDKPTYNLSIEILRKAINWAKLGLGEKREAIDRTKRMEKTVKS